MYVVVVVVDATLLPSWLTNGLPVILFIYIQHSNFHSHPSDEAGSDRGGVESNAAYFPSYYSKL